jgi:hypothetical protein
MLIKLLSLVPAVQELWNAWEIHCLILLSLSLQVFLFLFAGLRRRNSSRILGIVLWLAYLSADSVAVFVLGHLAVRAGEPGHQLMTFWAPFMLVHLGGQDTITAFSKQDNELWMRHLLNLVTQAVVAGYVEAKASWPDHRLRAAMVLMFLSGCIKYAERINCLYLASPARLRTGSIGTLSRTLRGLKSLKLDRAKLLEQDIKREDDTDARNLGFYWSVMSDDDIMSMDAPLNDRRNMIRLDCPLDDKDSMHCYQYKLVAARLVDWYKDLYTKHPLRHLFKSICIRYARCFLPFGISLCSCQQYIHDCSLEACIYQVLLTLPVTIIMSVTLIALVLLYPLFRYVATPIALVLFTTAEKGDRLHTSQADITMSYALLIGAIVLDVSSAIKSPIKLAILCVDNFIQIQPAWCRKQWSEELAQYNMIKRHVVQDTSGIMSSIRQCFSKLLESWGIELFDVTHTSIIEYDAPIKEFILENLLRFGTRKEWHVASSRGQLTVQNWMRSHQQDDPDSSRIGSALEKIITSGVDFPTSLLIWHIATDICYFQEIEATTSTSNGQLIKKHKEMSRKLSNYIMYLVFKCGVMLTTNSQVVHEEAHDEIRSILTRDHNPFPSKRDHIPCGEQATTVKLFNATKEEELQVRHLTIDINNVVDSHVQKLGQIIEAIASPVVPRACFVAKELMSIKDTAERWELIAGVWSEMIYYAAPRCGCAFHYEHLCTGGEFITHVLVLMKTLGPFLPLPSA